MISFSFSEDTSGAPSGWKGALGEQLMGKRQMETTSQSPSVVGKACYCTAGPGATNNSDDRDKDTSFNALRAWVPPIFWWIRKVTMTSNNIDIMTSSSPTQGTPNVFAVATPLYVIKWCATFQA